MLRAQASVEKGDRPRPPYLSTVMQLGLSPHSLGAPSLLVRGTFGSLACHAMAALPLPPSAATHH